MSSLRKPSLLAFCCAAYCLVSVPAVAQAVGAEDSAGAERFVSAGAVHAHATQMPLAAFGPFKVLDPAHAALTDNTDTSSPTAFATMLKAFPRIAVLEMVECPGTEDDTANLKLGRMIRAARIATHVPAGGSVRSGAVELFLAGEHRSAEPDAEFAVHGWRDEEGREPGDFSPDAPVNQAYLRYYAEMGMSPDQAKAFYAMTNSVRNAEALWLTREDLKRYAALD